MAAHPPGRAVGRHHPRMEERDDQTRRQTLRDDSDELLSALDELRALERRKRQERISSSPFHRLAEDVAEASRRVFRVAEEERRVGDEFDEQQPVTTEDVPPEPRP